MPPCGGAPVVGARCKVIASIGSKRQQEDFDDRARMYQGSSLIFLPDDCTPYLPVKRQRIKASRPAFEPAPAPTAPPHPAPARSNGFRQKKSTYRMSAAPSGRGRCRRCRAVIAKGETRLEICAFVRPGRYTLLLRCTAPALRLRVLTRRSQRPSCQSIKASSVCLSTRPWREALRRSA